jgi:acyl-CoA thioesterase-2
MDAATAELLDLLNLQSAGQGVYLGAPSPDARMRVFGGQVLAQALAAASFTAPQWPCHSLHAYFLRPGKPGRPIEYEVAAMRDGNTFATRKVAAVQRDELNLELVASFVDAAPALRGGASAEREESGAEYQVAMPDVPAPESFPGEDERTAALLASAPPELHEHMQRKRPVELIRIDARDFRDRTPSSAPVRTWMRVRSPLMDDPNLHRCALAYASDMGALEPSLRAIGGAFGDSAMQVASLDHALWFHRPFRFDDWLLFAFEPVSVAGGRGLSRGCVWSRDGQLVASIAQEGVMRKRDELAAL